jgi:hypothetical protein
VKDPWFKSIGLTLKDWGFNLSEQRGPDAEHFGNWVLVGHRDNLALRVFRDRGHVNFDLMPIALFKSGADESNWFTWDVVTRALGIGLGPEEDALRSFLDHFFMIDEAFSPNKWDKTAAILAAVEQEKRRRFTEGHREERRVPAHT